MPPLSQPSRSLLRDTLCTTETQEPLAILVVDIAPELECVCPVLESIGYRPVGVRTIEQAVEHLRSGSAADLILFAVDSAQSSPEVAIEELHRSLELLRVPVVGVTSNDSSDHTFSARLLEAGAASVLSRPLRLLDLQGLSKVVRSAPQRPGMSHTEVLVRERVLSKGSQGVVYLMHSEGDSSKQYALKEMRLNGVSGKAKARAKAELAVLETLNSPCIVKYFNGAVGRHVRILMEYCEGGSLKDRLRWHRDHASRPPFALVVCWLSQIVLAMLHYRQKRIIHRDLKSENVLLTGDDRIKLCDFGVCKSLEGDTAAVSMVGSPSTYPPEMLAGPRRATFKADIWGLGCVLFECLSENAETAFPTNLPFMQLVQCICSQEPRPLPSTTPPFFQAMVRQLLQKDPALRPCVGELAAHPVVSGGMVSFAHTHQLEEDVADCVPLPLLGRDLAAGARVTSTFQILGHTSNPTFREVAHQNEAVVEDCGSDVACARAAIMTWPMRGIPDRLLEETEEDDSSAPSASDTLPSLPVALDVEDHREVLDFNPTVHQLSSVQTPLCASTRIWPPSGVSPRRSCGRRVPALNLLAGAGELHKGLAGTKQILKATWNLPDRYLADAPKWIFF
mmetsp:Transcript_88576/g.236748  ORF Transcript_88576/g.236748 Transcript_88576/m.236748 type:complete len:621 (+) Transcript_88576:48-1910(+)